MDKLDPAWDAAAAIATSRKRYWGGNEYFKDACPKIKIDLDKQMQHLKNNDLDDVEALLYSQAVTLNQVFNSHLMMVSFSEDDNEIQMHSQLAFKAQNQCRNTLATLAEIKRPSRTIFVRNQNNAFNQQINCSKKELSGENSENELLEVENDKRLDIGTKVPSVTVNPSMEAMDTINGGEDH